MNNNNNNLKALMTHLDQEIQWVEAINLILTDEKEVLASRQFTHLEALAEKKSVLSDQLEESAKQRMVLIGHSNNEASAALALQAFLQPCTEEEAKKINSLNNQLAEKLTLCRELNTVNGQVIASNLHARQEIVNALSGNQVDAVSVYTANGNINTASDNNHHQEA